MKVIAVSREYGAGGHSIAVEVAERLGVEFYDRDIIKNAAKESGIDPELLEKSEESISRADSFIRTISPISYDQADAIFNAEKQVIIEIAKKGPCVILGRCADVILKEAGIDCLSVLLYADVEAREKRVGELIGSDKKAEIDKAIKKVDHNRHSHYAYFTDKHWGDYKNYNIMLDTGALGYERCIDMIVDAAK